MYFTNHVLFVILPKKTFKFLCSDVYSTFVAIEPSFNQIPIIFVLIIESRFLMYISYKKMTAKLERPLALLIYAFVRSYY